MGVEADTWESDGTLPVGKVVALVVGELSELVKGHAGVVGDNEVLGWGDGTNSDLVWDEEELKVVRNNIGVDHRSGFWVELSVEEESVINSLVDEDFSELGVVS